MKAPLPSENFPDWPGSRHNDEVRPGSKGESDLKSDQLGAERSLRESALPRVESEEVIGQKLDLSLAQEISPVVRNFAEYLATPKSFFTNYGFEFDLDQFREACKLAIESGYAEYERFSILISHNDNAVAIIDRVTESSRHYTHKYIEDEHSFGMMPISLKSHHAHIAECLGFKPSGGGQVSVESQCPYLIGSADGTVQKFQSQYIIGGGSESYGRGDHMRAGLKLAKLLALAPKHMGIVHVQ